MIFMHVDSIQNLSVIPTFQKAVMSY